MFYNYGNFIELAEKINILINDKILRNTLGQNAKNKADKYFSPQLYIDLTFDIINKVILKI